MLRYLFRVDKLRFAILSLFFVFYFLSIKGGAADNLDVGMILSVKGRAYVVDVDKKTRILRPMDTLSGGDILATSKDSRVIFVMFSSNQEYTLFSSSKVKIIKSKVKEIMGTVKVNDKKVSLGLPINSSVYSRKMLGGQARPVVDELMGLQNPIPGGKALSRNIRFQWHLEDLPESVTFTLTKISDDDDPSKDEKIFETVIKGKNYFIYPSRGQKSLEFDKKYQVSIQGNYPEVKKDLEEINTITKSFTVLNKEEERSILKYRNFANASLRRDPGNFNPLKILMFLYMANDLYLDAVDVGKILEGKMDNKKNLYLFMHQSYKKLGMLKRASEYGKKAGVYHRENNNS